MRGGVGVEGVRVEGEAVMGGVFRCGLMGVPAVLQVEGSECIVLCLL